MTKDQDIKIKKIYSKSIVSKRNARILSVQVIYSYLMRESFSIPALDSMLYHSFKDAADIDQVYATALVIGAIKNRSTLEDKIQKYLSESWKFHRLAKVMQAILLAAVYELLFTSDLSSSILINEYIEISKLMNHEGESGFVNRVLDELSKSHQASES